MPIGIEMNNYDISMGIGMLRVGGGGGLAGNVYINGNVGIGTSSPAATLDVNGSINANSTIATTGVISSKSSLISQSSTANTGHIRVASSASANYIQSGLTATSGSSAPLYFTDIFDTNRWMTITSDGKVGIGTTSPAATLDVNGTTATNKMLIRNTDFAYSLATQVYTANTWYEAVPTGKLTANSTYIVTLRLTTVGAPFILTTSFLFQALSTNGSNNSIGAAVPTAAHDTGASDYQIYVRGKAAGGGVISGIEFKVSSTTTTGEWVVGVYRII